MNNLLRFLSIFTVAIYVQTNSSASYAMNVEEYDPTKRPAIVQQLIDRNFNDLSSRSWSSWLGSNGMERYCIFEIDEQLLLKAIILDSPDQYTFNFLDMGGGRFQWGHALGEFLDNDKELANRDFKVNIINTGGEQYQGQKVKNTKKCTIYNFGAFKLENLKESLNKEGLFTKGETFDFIIASWCLRHLTDPLGTMVQAHDLLGPKRLMLFDGFSFSVAFQDEGHPLAVRTSPQCDCFLIKSLLDMEIPFLMYRYRGGRSNNHFMIQKLEKNIQRLPYGFEGIHDTGEARNNSRYYLKFNAIKNKNNMHEIREMYDKYDIFMRRNSGSTILYGDKLLFDYINKFDIYGDDPIKFFVSQ